MLGQIYPNPPYATDYYTSITPATGTAAVESPEATAKIEEILSATSLKERLAEMAKTPLGGLVIAGAISAVLSWLIGKVLNG